MYVAINNSGASQTLKQAVDKVALSPESVGIFQHC